MKRISLLLLTGLFFTAFSAAQIGNFSQRGKATQGLKFNGLGLAHPSLPINSKVMVVNTLSGKETEATVTGRIPASQDRIADLSSGIWHELGLNPGTDIKIYTSPVPRQRPPSPVSPVEAIPSLAEIPENKSEPV